MKYPHCDSKLSGPDLKYFVFFFLFFFSYIQIDEYIQIDKMYCKIVHIFCVFKTLLEVWYLALRTGKVHGINGEHTGRAMDSRAGSSKAHDCRS